MDTKKFEKILDKYLEIWPYSIDENIDWIGFKKAYNEVYGTAKIQDIRRSFIGFLKMYHSAIEKENQALQEILHKLILSRKEEIKQNYEKRLEGINEIQLNIKHKWSDPEVMSKKFGVYDFS